MPAETWVIQNKTRPGVYLKTGFDTSEVINYASEGVIAINYTLPLNPQTVIEITSTTVRNNDLVQYGVIPNTDSYKYITTLLKYCNKLILYSPATTGGALATLIIASEFTATAKYQGLEGNSFSVEVIGENTENQTFNTYYGNDLVAIQTLEQGTTELIGDNNYLDIVVSGTVSPLVPTVLSGGVDGVFDTTVLQTRYFDIITNMDWEVLVMNDSTGVLDYSQFKNFLDEYNGNHVYRAQLVKGRIEQSEPSRNSELVITVENQEVHLQNGLVLDVGLLAGYIGARTAGATYREDLTYTALDDIISITELTSAQIEENIRRGILTLSLRSDRTPIIEDDINSLVIVGDNQSSVLKANDTIRLLNDLSVRLVSFGETTIIGKTRVTDTTLNLVKSFVVGIMNEYVTEQVITNFVPDTDVQVVFGEQPDGILCSIALQKTNSTKKLYFEIIVR